MAIVSNRANLGKEEREKGTVNKEERDEMNLVLVVTLSNGRELTRFIDAPQHADNIMHNWRVAFEGQSMRWEKLNVPYHAVTYWEVREVK